LKKLELGQIISILANVGVIAGIAFLAVELRQNNDLLAAEARLAQSERSEQTFNDIIRVPELAEAISKARAGEELTPQNDLQLRAFLSRQFRSWEWQYFERELGALDSLPLNAWRNVVRGTAGLGEASDGHTFTPQWAAAWASNRSMLRPEFVGFMDREVFDQ